MIIEISPTDSQRMPPCINQPFLGRISLEAEIYGHSSGAFHHSYRLPERHNAFLVNHINGHCYVDTEHKQRQCIELSEMSKRARKGSGSSGVGTSRRIQIGSASVSLNVEALSVTSEFFGR